MVHLLHRLYGVDAPALSGRGQGHVSNFYIVDLENFSASRRYTGDIPQIVRGRFVYDT